MRKETVNSENDMEQIREELNSSVTFDYLHSSTGENWQTLFLIIVLISC